ncbi:hypothetical protein [Legionella cincinnatiensis]|uniref:Nuclear transport factor 2 family protein n=1 Tax=Legionella cincinnatiensis TaxID=28085 RepID=A0A378IIN7_9GAMM|nr:hypothetical protein [Legionella cincinnatiensis]KTC93182.1 hypothetical protein Lcin_0220 [Legionella cincinnatiensis]STX35117.1 Uncharacterised protein [Legionella cincinnatiensis]
MSIIAKRFLESWFYDVWVLSSVENMKRYYATSVTGEFNGETLSREELEKHCAWGKDNEKITHFEFIDVVSEDNKIAFCIQFQFTDQTNNIKKAENIGIMHLDPKGKIHSITVKSSEQFSR